MKKKITHYSAWFICLVLGIVCGVQLFIWGGRPAILIVFGLSLAMVVFLEWCLNSSNSGSNTEDVEVLREKLANKTELAEDQIKSIRFLHSERESLNRECEAYRTQRDEAHIREELYKKQIRELRGRAEYWRAKYKALMNAETDPDDTEIVITPNPDAEC